MTARASESRMGCALLIAISAGGAFLATRDARSPEQKALYMASQATRMEQQKTDRAIVEKCQSYVISQAKHPSTVKFERIAEPHRNEDGSGIVGIRFRAKNSFGLELTYVMVCVVSTTGEASGLATESN